MNKRLYFKNIIFINLILIILLNIIPKIKKEEFKTEIKENQLVEETRFEEIQTENNITSRSNEPRQIKLIEKNLKLTVTSDLRIISNLSSEEFDKMLQDTNLYGLGKSLEKVEKKYSLNGLYIMGLACLESNYGNSNYARKRNNLVGWNAVDSNPDKASYFNSKDECILFVAKKLKTNYLTEDGCYFNGYTAKAIDVRYCTDKQHCYKIINIVNNLIKKL